MASETITRNDLKAVLDEVLPSDTNGILPLHTTKLTSSSNMDTLTQGVYLWDTSTPTNAPSGIQYCIALVFEGHIGVSYYNLQIVSSSGRGLYYRRKMGASGDAFAAWTKVTGTQV